MGYFDEYVDIKEAKGFSHDKMLQEWFKDAVENSPIALRVVGQLKKGSRYNECGVEKGML